MSALPESYLTPEEYLERERTAEEKSEYFAGCLYAMAGATEAHNLINVNISSELRQQLKGSDCRVYANDLKIKVEKTGLYAYPDVIVACGERRFEERTNTQPMEALLNPGVLIEILLPSTESFDRGRKFSHYQQLDSLKEYIIVAQDRPYVDHFTKHGNQEWLLRVAEGLQERLYLPSIQCALALSDIYDNVEFASNDQLR